MLHLRRKVRAAQQYLYAALQRPSVFVSRSGSGAEFILERLHMAKTQRGSTLGDLHRSLGTGGQVPPNPAWTSNDSQAKARIGLTLLRVLGNQRSELKDLGRDEVFRAQIRGISLAADLAEPNFLLLR